MGDDTPPSLRSLIESIIDAKLQQLVVGPQPGRVTKYNEVKQSASIQPLIKDVHNDESGRRVTRLRPICQDVPILMLGGNGTRVTTGLKIGDYVLMLPCSAAIARWLVRGGEVDPGEGRGSLSDCIALGGLHLLTGTPLSKAPASALVLHGTDIRLGNETATDNDNKVVIKKFLRVMRAGLTSPNTAFGGADGGATFVSTFKAYLDAQLGGTDWVDGAATRVKAK